MLFRSLQRLHLGTLISFNRSGRHISGVKVVSASSRTVSFFARALKIGPHQLIVRATDGSKLTFGPKPPVTLKLHGLAAGQKARFTATLDRHGHVTITITSTFTGGAQATTTGGTPTTTTPASQPQDAVGTITQVASDQLTIQTADGRRQSWSVDPTSGLTDGFLVGDLVDVTYDPGSTTASDVEYVENTISGIATALTIGSVTVGNQTFLADPETIVDVLVGDQLTIDYHTAAAGLVADEVDDQALAAP